MRESIPMRLRFKPLIAVMLALTGASAVAAGLALFVSEPALVVTTSGDIGGPFTLVSTRAREVVGRC